MNEPIGPTGSLPAYRYPGARSLVLLHERHLRRFFAAWQRARAVDLALPRTEDRAYVSLDTLLWHLCDCARHYLTWTCRCLELPDPGLAPVPAVDDIADRGAAYLAHLLDRWREPLAGVEEERFYRPEYLARWRVKYCIDAMLEHAVMHPLRHAYQLETLLGPTRD